MSKPKSQNHRIAQDLMRGHKITALDAMTSYGCMRLASRISDIRATGIPVIMELIQTSTGKHIARYHIPIEYRRAMRQAGKVGMG